MMSQLGVCLFVPCAFLVLGGKLLDVVIPDAFSPRVWTILMAITNLPVTLIPTLKEGAMAAFAGCLGTIVADFISTGILVYYIGHAPGSPPAPTFDFDNIAMTFGNLSLAYGAGIVIPDLQRQHSQPERMPRVVFVTIVFVSILFATIATTGYSMVGCQIPGNLLFAVAGHDLGFDAQRSALVLAYLAMQLHITIGLSVLLHPALYYAESLALGLHRAKTHEIMSHDKDHHDEDEDRDSHARSMHNDDTEASSQAEACLREYPQKKMLLPLSAPASSRNLTKSEASVGHTFDHVREEEEEDEEEKKETHDPKFMQCCLLRTAILAILTFFSVLLHNKLNALVDLVGASSVSLSCIVLPIWCYLKVCHDVVPTWERLYGYLVMVICGLLSIYVTIKSAIEMFAPDNPHIVFPFCPVTYQQFPFTNVSYYANVPATRQG
jgi:vesicular inhibitory amino acid transporter